MLALVISACGRCDFAPTVADSQAGSYAQVTFMQDNATALGSTGTITLPYSTDQLAGDTDVVVVTFNTSVSRVTDASGNSYRLVVGPTDGGLTLQSIYAATNIVAAPAGTNIVSIDFVSTDAPTLRIFEYAGIDGTIDGTPSSAGTDATVSLDAAVTTAQPDLLFAASWCNTSVVGGTSSFGQRLRYQSTLVQDLVTDAPGTFDATMTTGATNSSEVIQLVPFRRAKM